MSKIPGTFQNGGGPGPQVPPDLPWPCTIYSCSGDLEHTEACDGACETWEPTEKQVTLQNLQREYMRHGLDSNSVGTAVGITELFLRAQATEKLLLEFTGTTRDEYDERFRDEKIEFLQIFLDKHLEEVKRARTANALGIIEKPGLLGPDGKPL